MPDSPSRAESAEEVRAREQALYRKHAADRVANFPIVELAIDLRAHGGPDMRGEAEALDALLADFAERMRRKP